MSEHIIDPTVFGEMRELMDDSLGEFIQTYLENSPLLIEKIATGLAENNAEVIYHNAHQLKGGSGSIGAMKLAEIALGIEAIGKNGGTDGVEVLLDQLKSEFEQVKAVLEAEL